MSNVIAQQEPLVSKDLLSQNTNQCTDQCILECYGTGSSDCFNTCNCQTDSYPSVTDLLDQNTCYSNCGKECLLLDSLAERQDCFDACPCQCNKFCFKQCHGAGLSQVCDSSCGCKRQTHTAHTDSEESDDENELETKQPVQDEQEKQQPEQEEQNEQEQQQPEQDEQKPQPVQDEKNEQESQQPEQNEQEQEQPAQNEQNEQESQQPIQTEQLNEVGSFGFIDALVAESTMDFELTPETGFELIEFGNTNIQSDEFKTIMTTESDDEEPRCDPGCWRSCLQMKATKDQVFSCINTCGCAYESPHLLLLSTSTLENIEETPVSGLFLVSLFLVFAFIVYVAFYIYKQEYEHKLEEFYHQTDDEEGYEKLD